VGDRLPKVPEQAKSRSTLPRMVKNHNASHIERLLSRFRECVV